MPIMKQVPTVSIIVNNYNYGRFLREAIDSALSQTYPSTEVIVVDDGSTDNSREVIASYGSRIVPVLKENGGQASALNAGFAACTGEMAFFLDSDDLLLPTAAETVVHEWRHGLARVHFPLEVVDANGWPVREVVGGSKLSDPTLGPFVGDSPTSANVFSREALDRVMPIPEGDFGRYPDAYVTATTSMLGAVRLVQRPLGKYRIHGNNKHLSDMGLAQARRSICATLRLYEALSRLDPDRIGPLGKWLARCPQHWVSRITSLRESPQDHPWPDTLTVLMRRAIGATWCQPYWNFRRKLAYTVFVIGYSLSPQVIRRALKKAEGNTHAFFPKFLLGSPPARSGGLN